MKYEEFAALEDTLEGAQYICSIEHDEIPEKDSLFTFLENQPAPYFNYILCALSDNLEIWPFYVGYTADLLNRINTHAQRVEFDMVFLFHSASKELALSNEQRLMDLFCTRDLMNGRLTQMPHVSRGEILEVLAAQNAPMDRSRKYAEAGIVRKTYYLNDVLYEALRTYGYDHNTEVSETVRLCLVGGIPSEYLDAAYNKIYSPRKVTA